MQKAVDKYTIFCEYKKGTYISQFLSPNLEEALNLWKSSMDVSIYGLKSIKQIQEIVFRGDLYAPIVVEGVDNVWCVSFVINRNLFLLNIIKTV
jgi:hypothetical protein